MIMIRIRMVLGMTFDNVGGGEDEVGELTKAVLV